MNINSQQQVDKQQSLERNRFQSSAANHHIRAWRHPKETNWWNYVTYCVVNMSLFIKWTRKSYYQHRVCSAAYFLSSGGSDAGSSLCAGGLDVQAVMHRLCASTHPGKEEQGTLQRRRDRNQGSSVNSRVCNL